MSDSLDPTDINFEKVSGIITINDKLYEGSQILQSLFIQGFPIKKFGSALKIGNQIVSPMTSSSYSSIPKPEAQNIIQSQFHRLFEEIDKLGLERKPQYLKDKLYYCTIVEDWYLL